MNKNVKKLASISTALLITASSVGTYSSYALEGINTEHSTVAEAKQKEQLVFALKCADVKELEGMKFTLKAYDEKDEDTVKPIEAVVDKGGFIRFDIEKIDKKSIYKLEAPKGLETRNNLEEREIKFDENDGILRFGSNIVSNKEIRIFVVEESLKNVKKETPKTETPDSTSKEDKKDDGKKDSNQEYITYQLTDTSNKPVEGKKFQLVPYSEKGLENLKTLTAVSDKDGFIKFKIADIDKNEKYKFESVEELEFVVKCDEFVSYDSHDGKLKSGEAIFTEKPVKLIISANSKDEEKPSDTTGTELPPLPDLPLPDEDKTEIHDVTLRIIDSKTKAPIEGVSFMLDNGMDLEKEIITDENGIALFPKEIMKYDGEYSIRLIDPALNYFPVGGTREWKLKKVGNKMKINGEEYTGSIFTIAVDQKNSEGGKVDEPIVKNADFVKVQVVDETMKPVNDCVLAVKDMNNYAVDCNIAAQENGVSKITMSENFVKFGMITTSADTNYEAARGPVVFNYENGIFTKVNHEKYKGETVTLVVKKKEKYKKVTDILPDRAYMPDNKHIKVVFSEDVNLVDEDIDSIKSKIYIADFKNKDLKKVSLGKNDKVEAEGKVLTITLEKEPESIISTDNIYLERGTIVNKSGYVNKDVKWAVDVTTKITKTIAEKDVYDHKGGVVKIRLTGVRVNQIKENELKYQLFKAGQDERVTDIPVKFVPGEEPYVTFTVPENKTDSTESYFLSYTLNNLPVYEDTGLNHAAMTVISVLPEGKKMTDQTVSALTISGNNPIKKAENGRYLSVAVKKTSGELKVSIRLFGTNLVSSKTEIRAIDEDGVIWPVYHCPV